MHLRQNFASTPFLLRFLSVLQLSTGQLSSSAKSEASTSDVAIGFWKLLDVATLCCPDVVVLSPGLKLISLCAIIKYVYPVLKCTDDWRVLIRRLQGRC